MFFFSVYKEKLHNKNNNRITVISLCVIKNFFFGTFFCVDMCVSVHVQVVNGDIFRKVCLGQNRQFIVWNIYNNRVTKKVQTSH